MITGDGTFKRESAGSQPTEATSQEKAQVEQENINGFLGQIGVVATTDITQYDKWVGERFAADVAAQKRAVVISELQEFHTDLNALRPTQAKEEMTWEEALVLGKEGENKEEVETVTGLCQKIDTAAKGLIDQPLREGATLEDVRDLHTRMVRIKNRYGEESNTPQSEDEAAARRAAFLKSLTGE